MEQKKSKLSKIGTVWEKKDKSGFFIKLGNQNKKNSKYDLHVELLVKDSEGNVVSKQTDGFLTLVNPKLQAQQRGDEKALASLEQVPGLKYEILAANE
jgi:hypothetical protein